MFRTALELCPYCYIALRRDEIEDHIISTPYCISQREKDEEDENYGTGDDSVEYLPIWHNLIETYEEDEDEEEDKAHPEGEDEIGSESFSCLICLSNKPQIMGECSHLCCCITCSKKIYDRHNICPVCRLPRNRLIKVFTGMGKLG